jgi:beta-glucosidase
MTIGLAAGFDPDLAHSYGDIIGSEAATLGQHVLEGPGLCLHRTTIAGRNSTPRERPRRKPTWWS